MKSIFVQFVIIILLVGCDSKPPIELSTEQAIYESLFLEIMGDTYSKYYIAENTEYEWFIINSIENSNWEDALDDLGGVSIKLVQNLYDINKESVPLNWNPILTNAEFLPADYVKVSKNDDPDPRCLVGESEGNIDVRLKSGEGFRSYYTVSKVAFSSNKNYALLKYSYRCAPLSGAGEFFVSFQFKDNRWQYIGGRLLWIS